jgi:hypothetical protein
MTFKYDKKSDTLTVTFGSKRFDPSPFETGDFTVSIDDADTLVEFKIANASKFIARALAAGVKVEGVQTPEPPQKPEGMVWHSADSSMISGFGYDESEGILEIAFNNTGVYRYFDVPVNVFEELRDASSKGSYIRDMIIDMYDYEKKKSPKR